MTKEKSVHDVLHRIQKNLKVPKSQKNTFGGYSFRSAEDILEHLKEQLQDGETIRLTDDLQLIGERYYVKAKASLCSGSDCVSASAFAREADQRKGFGEDQLTGAASSYARKYALNALFCIDDTKDADATNDGKDEPKSDKKPEPKKVKDQSPEEREMAESYKRIFGALKEAPDSKKLNAIWHLQEKEIKTFPKAAQDKLKELHNLKTADFTNVTMAG